MKEKSKSFAVPRDKKKIILLVVCGMIGLSLIAVGAFADFPLGRSEKNSSFSYYTAELETRIEELCKSINGIEYAKVLLMLDGGSEYVYAQNEQPSSKDYVIITNNKSDSTVLVNEIYPKIRGVAVVCTGGERAEVQMKVTELLSAALGIGSNRIKVAGSRA